MFHPMTIYTADKIAETAADPVCSVIFVVCAVIAVGTSIGVLAYCIIDDIRRKRKAGHKKKRGR